MNATNYDCNNNYNEYFVLFMIWIHADSLMLDACTHSLKNPKKTHKNKRIEI